MITSTSNPQVKNLQQLAKKARARNEQDVFLVEGMKMFQEAPREKIKKVYISKSLFEEKGQAFLKGLEYEVLDEHVFSAASDTKTPQGILCVVEQMNYSLENVLENGEVPHLMVLDNLQDPGNLGTIVRTAEGAGVTGVIMSKETVDIYNPKVVRSAMGSLFRMKFKDSNILELENLKKDGFTIVATALYNSQPIEKAKLSGKRAIVIGNEAQGVSQDVLNLADMAVRIDMCGSVESLNAAVAAGISMYMLRP